MNRWLTLFGALCASFWLTAVNAFAASDDDTPRPAMTVRVDASNTAQWIFQVHETIPAESGPLRLLYPRWLPGFHGPAGDVVQLAGLTVRVGGQRLLWTRAADELHGFDVQVPEGAHAIDVHYQWLGPTKGALSDSLQSRDALALTWPSLLLYPSNRPLAEMEVASRVKLPVGWSWGSALRASAVSTQGEGWVEFQTETLETLLDSPVYAGVNYRRVELDPPGTARPAALHLFRTRDGGTAPSDEQIDTHRRLLQQAEKLFGFRPWRHYDLLLADGKGFGHIALEHHESSENSYDGDYFADWAAASRSRDDLAHELTHAWNGKFRRPRGLEQLDLNSPTRNELLWVYEGLTQYWGQVLAVRSGLVTAEQMRHDLALTGARTADLPGRQWRDLQDTTNTPALASHGTQKWWDWTLGYDYYNDAALLIWLDADTLIRERSGGQRSLDDFARRFFNGQDGNRTPSVYGIDDVVAALNAVEPMDWRRFLRARLDHRMPTTTLDGLARSGWTVAFVDKRTPLQLASLNAKKPLFSMRYSAGVSVDAEGSVVGVNWASPAFSAGLAPDDKLLAVNGRAFTPERAEAALNDNRSGDKPLQLLIHRDDEFRTVALDVRTGPRHPVLQRVEGRPDVLAEIFKAR
ncbi:MAG: M61 family peptidase [Rubrivivax sp.]|nr:MAG: M61 family peptidase [Rubrivivax sp.]